MRLLKEGIVERERMLGKERVLWSLGQCEVMGMVCLGLVSGRGAPHYVIDGRDQ